MQSFRDGYIFFILQEVSVFETIEAWYLDLQAYKRLKLIELN